MSIPKEPRQLMINLMYLVLTAMLALNISAEILNAFKVVDKGISKSNKVLNDKSTQLMSSIEASADQDERPEADSIKNAAMAAKQATTDLYNYIGSLKEGVLIEAAGSVEAALDPETGELSKSVIKDKDVTTRYFVDQAKGDELFEKMNTARTSFLNMIDEENRPSFESQLSVKASQDDVPTDAKNKDKTWSQFYFDHVPLIAATTILTKFQNDVKSDEATLMEYYAKQFGAEDIKFDKFIAVTAPTTGVFLLSGEKYSADIFLSAYSTASENMEIQFGGGARQPLKDGKYTYSATASGLGKKTYGGTIYLKNPKTQKEDEFEFKGEYEVGTLGASISADKMNVFYIGVDNPVSVAVSGAPANQVSASMTGGSISKSGNGYVVRVTTPGSATVTVNAKGRKAGAMNFRVKRIPDPIAKLGSMKSGSAKSGSIKAQRGLIADLENFAFDIRFNIVGFEMTYAAKRQDLVTVQNSGGTLKGTAATLLKKAKPGDLYYFDNIRVKGPDGQVRKIPGISFKVL